MVTGGGHQEECETAPWAFTELFEINLNYAIKQMPMGMDNFLFLKRLPTAALDGISINYTELLADVT